MINRNPVHRTIVPRLRLLSKGTVLLSALALGYLVFAGYLFRYSYVPKVFHEDILIRDLILLDGWGLSFFVVAIALWSTKMGRRIKVFAYLVTFGIYGFITVAVIFDGTPFGLNAFWGDQSFRMAMITKFAASVVPRDFYYKGLPPFYPPLLYYLLALYSRLAGVEAFKMIKICSMAVYLFGPFLVYYVWRRLVAPLQAAIVTIFTFLFATSGLAYPLLVPHAFVANTLFVPWWLYYVEQIRRPVPNWKYYLWGGLIGGMLFMTYFYPFFIGGCLLILRYVMPSSWSNVPGKRHFKLKPALGVLAVSALASLPYWLPLFVSIFAGGIDRSRAGWHHIGSAGLDFAFLEFSLPGVLFVAGVFYSVRRAGAQLHRSLLLLLGSSIIFLLAGSVLGYFDISVNLAKLKQFVAMFGGVFIGFAMAGITRISVVNSRYRRASAALVMIVLLILINAFQSAATNPKVKTARNTVPPTENVSQLEKVGIEDKVVLTGYHWLPSFTPVYTFLAGNEHYAHPASRHFQRHNLLRLMHDLSDAYLFNLGLTHNVFDKVDYYIPRRAGQNLEITANLSNYPNRLLPKKFTVSARLFSDKRLYAAAEADLPVFKVLPPTGESRRWDGCHTDMSREKCLLFLARTKQLEKYLNEEGRILAEQYIRENVYRWHVIDDEHVFADTMSFLESYVASDGDSLYFVLGFQPKHQVFADYKIFLHVWDDTGQRYNFDFEPSVPVSRWEKADIQFCCRAIPSIAGEIRFNLGFYDGDYRLGEAFHGRVNLASDSSSS